MNKIKEVFFAGAFYEVAEIKRFPHGKMIGIYDEPPSKHIDYLHPNSVHKVENCNNCQGCGCTVCNGFGKIVGELMTKP
jgi:hypothetical protein